MKRLAFLLATFCALLSFTACDDDTTAILPTLPPSSNSPVVVAIKHTGNVPECYDWSFKYKHHRLNTANGVYRNPDPKKDGSHKYTSTICYGSDRISVKNVGSEGGDISLGANNLISTITSKNMTQKFYYKDGRLSEWEKEFRGVSYGHVEELITKASIKYVDNNYKSITYMNENNGITDTICVLTFTPDVQPNNNGLLPEVVSQELGLIGIEHLYYAGLLGKGSKHLVKTISASYPKDLQQNWNVSFDYSHQDGNTTSCNYLFQNQASSAIYSY